ncbi:MAG: hypothetical protein MJ252_11340 [archaeon]|nr:hypothetical protein [archaeon]
MEKENNSGTKRSFVNLFTQLTKISMEANAESNRNYQKGRKEAMEEVIQWYNNVYATDKMVSANALMMFLQEKIEKTKLKMDIKNEPDIKPIFDISAIKKNEGNNDVDMA